MSMVRELKGHLRFEIAFETVTGLLIKAPSTAQMYRIGRPDTYPMTTMRVYVINGQNIELEVPYVPGSSIKGKIRYHLELFNGLKLYSTDNKIWRHVRNVETMTLSELIDDIVKRCVVDDLLGYSAFNLKQLAEAIARSRGRERPNDDDINEAKKYFSYLAPTRLDFSDFYPSSRYVESKKPTSVADFLEEKVEIGVDRITVAADLRSIVRVIPGVEFEGTATLRVFDIDRDVLAKYLNALATGLEFLELTHLGSSGSRGYGRIRFTLIKLSVLKPNKNEQLLVDISNEVRKRGIKMEYTSLHSFKSDLQNLAKALIEMLYS